jgi:hypothetical protein
MKTSFINKYILLAAFMVLSMNSCKKFLDEQPQASTAEEAIFTNPQTAYMALLGVYNQLAGDNAFGQRLSVMFPFDTDEMTGYDLGSDSQTQLNNYATTSSNGLISAVFNQLYNGVERANICIYNIPKMPMYANGTAAQQKDLKRLHGEALTLRALFYFELIKLWGDVPAHWEPARLLSNFNLPKTDRDVIYDKLIEDLKLASDLVPWRGEVASDERITKGAVKALRARLALFRGGYSLRRESKMMERKADFINFYTIARDECNDIMLAGKHLLNPSFEAVFREAILAHKIETNGEVLLEVAHSGNNGDSDSKVGAVNSVTYATGSATNPTYQGSGRNKIIPTLFYAYSPFDKRRDVSIAPYIILNDVYRANALTGASNQGSGLFDGKWRRDWITPVPAASAYYGINWPLIRFSDVLLMYAEAVNEISGPTPEAIDAANQVRRRSWAAGVVKSVAVTNGGANYTSAPTVTITGGGGSGATAIASFDAITKKVTRVDIVTYGSGHTSNPTIAFSGGGGTGVIANASITTLAEANLSGTQTASKSAFFDAIQKERLLEFAGEAIRKYDLIRWNLLATKIAETRTELQKMEPATLAAPYNTYASRMFYKGTSTGLVYGNSFYAPSPSALTGYLAVNWLSAITEALVRTPFASDFEPNKDELLPLPLTVIQNSNGVITQDFGN